MQDFAQTLEINHDYILNRIKENFPDQVLDSHEPFGLLTISVKKEVIFELIKFLKEDEILKFDFLTDICGIHFPDNTNNELGVIYHLHSLLHNIRLRIKIYTSKLDTAVQSMTSLFATANWMERETYDFYGIVFKGHPDLRRILNMDEMNYFPMRKEYPLQDGTRTDKDDKYFGR